MSTNKRLKRLGLSHLSQEQAQAELHRMIAEGTSREAIKRWRLRCKTHTEHRDYLSLLAELFHVAFHLANISKFIDASSFVLTAIRRHLGDEAAEAIDLKLLQGAYIAMSSSQEATEGLTEVLAVTSIDEINTRGG